MLRPAVHCPGYGHCLFCAEFILQVSSWLACLKVNLLSSYWCKAVSLICPGRIPAFEPWAGQYFQEENYTFFFFFWKLWFSNYLCTPLPPFPTYGSNWLSLISRAPILRNMWVSFVLVSALWGSQFCLLLFRDHTGVLSKLLPITK